MTSDGLVAIEDLENDLVWFVYASGRAKITGAYTSQTYENKAPSLSRGTSPIHHGGMMLKVVGDPARALEGSYWTDRETHGVLKGDKYSQDVYDRFEDASKGTYA